MGRWVYMVFAPDPYKFKLVEISQGYKKMHNANGLTSEFKTLALKAGAARFRTDYQTFQQAIANAGYTASDFDVFGFDLDSATHPNPGAGLYSGTLYQETVDKKIDPVNPEMVKKDNTYQTLAVWLNKIEQAITALGIVPQWTVDEDPT